MKQKPALSMTMNLMMFMKSKIKLFSFTNSPSEFTNLLSPIKNEKVFFGERFNN